jgi:hypothetical protein
MNNLNLHEVRLGATADGPDTRTMSTHEASWQINEKFLAKARALVPSSVAAANAADLKQFDD